MKLWAFCGLWRSLGHALGLDWSGLWSCLVQFSDQAWVLKSKLVPALDAPHTFKTVGVLQKIPSSNISSLQIWSMILLPLVKLLKVFFNYYIRGWFFEKTMIFIYPGVFSSPLLFQASQLSIIFFIQNYFRSSCSLLFPITVDSRGDITFGTSRDWTQILLLSKQLLNQ